ncbi:hypothetical protein K474DRAFT_1670584 [Panus rudis PR-1116 ss-1]|nr:hypothetical protein K474DRAFT_1670584 [Panus rudis PR-1116 ss-1]
MTHAEANVNSCFALWSRADYVLCCQPSQQDASILGSGVQTHLVPLRHTLIIHVAVLLTIGGCGCNGCSILG